MTRVIVKDNPARFNYNIVNNHYNALKQQKTFIIKWFSYFIDEKDKANNRKNLKVLYAKAICMY